MGLLSFIKEAGEKLFGTKQPDLAAAQAEVDAANQAAAEAITKYIHAQNLSADGLNVSFDGATGTVAVSGTAADQASKEKILLCCGNVAGVSQVEDNLLVAMSEPEAQYYTVVRGDTLSKIAQQYYGNANKYPVIFEANKPMLNHPDKIYPGQVLRIPPQA